MNWFGLGKVNRSKFGKWIDKKGYTQQEISDGSKVSKSTISQIANNDGFIPNLRTASKIIKFLNREGHDVNSEDFWC